MKKSYWEKIAPSYNDEIFDVLHNDKKALIRKTIKKYAGKNKSVIDIGCAIGKWLPVLSPLFKKVVAVDISAKNLAIAKKLYPQYKNVEYLRTDMSGVKAKLPECDFGICINALLSPSLRDRTKFFNALSAAIKKGGRLIITVPSLESYLLTTILQQQFKIDKGHLPTRAKNKEAEKKWNNIMLGNVDIDTVPHKHFLKEELQLLLSREGFATEAAHKIEYDWSTEFHKPPQWLKKPKPWDWMLVCKKR